MKLTRCFVQAIALAVAASRAFGADSCSTGPCQAGAPITVTSQSPSSGTLTLGVGQTHTISASGTDTDDCGDPTACDDPVPTVSQVIGPFDCPQTITYYLYLYDTHNAPLVADDPKQVPFQITVQRSAKIASYTLSPTGSIYADGSTVTVTFNVTDCASRPSGTCNFTVGSSFTGFMQNSLCDTVLAQPAVISKTASAGVVTVQLSVLNLETPDGGGDSELTQYIGTDMTCGGYTYLEVRIPHPAEGRL